jgi:peptide/nickel transport system permease protein
VQYLAWLGRALHGDFGKELSSGQPALRLVLSRLPVTLQLNVMALTISFVVGVTLGVIAATHRGTSVDAVTSAVSLAGLAMPSFWLALLLILLFSVHLHWFKVIGYTAFPHDPIENLRSLTLPALALGCGGAAIIARMTRSSMLEVLNQDYVRTARAKGLLGWTVLRRHTIRNALMPVVTVAGLQFGALLSGSVIIETIFSLPGLGRLLVNDILHREFLVVQCAVLAIAIGVVLTNLAVDLVYQFIDPRIRYD